MLDLALILFIAVIAHFVINAIILHSYFQNTVASIETVGDAMIHFFVCWLILIIGWPLLIILKGIYYFKQD